MRLTKFSGTKFPHPREFVNSFYSNECETSKCTDVDDSRCTNLANNHSPQVDNSRHRRRRRRRKRKVAWEEEIGSTGDAPLRKTDDTPPLSSDSVSGCSDSDPPLSDECSVTPVSTECSVTPVSAECSATPDFEISADFTGTDSCSDRVVAVEDTNYNVCEIDLNSVKTTVTDGSNAHSLLCRKHHLCNNECSDTSKCKFVRSSRCRLCRAEKSNSDTVDTGAVKRVSMDQPVMTPCPLHDLICNDTLYCLTGFECPYYLCPCEYCMKWKSRGATPCVMKDRVIPTIYGAECVCNSYNHYWNTVKWDEYMTHIGSTAHCNNVHDFVTEYSKHFRK